MTTTQKQYITYRVIVRTMVDHPELRSETLPKVRAGACIVNHASYEGAGRALFEMRTVLEGHWDFASEFAYAVDIERVNHTTGKRTTFRKRIERMQDRVAAADRAYLAELYQKAS